MSNHAQAAKLIRKELKEAFPKVKFSVRSQSYSMGSSVNISWTNGPTRDAVDKLVWKYQYGDFNSMEDIYEITNSREDIPQVKYVQTSREICEATQESVFKHLRETRDCFKQILSLDEFTDKLGNIWTARNYVYRILVKLDLTNGCNIEEIA